MPATLPDEYEEKDKLGLLPERERVYTVPWAMSVTHSGECYLNSEYTFQRSPYGTLEMAVERRADGYHVWLSPGFKYDKRDKPTGSWGAIPVAEVHTR